MMVESPIEADMLGAFLTASDRVELVPNATFSALLLMAQTQKDKIFLGTQVRICRFRADFILTAAPTAVYQRGLCVECDGAEWHTTDEQRRRDWDRDDRFNELKIDVLRFSGKRIKRDPHKCAYEALERVSGIKFRNRGDEQIGAAIARSMQALEIGRQGQRSADSTRRIVGDRE